MAVVCRFLSSRHSPVRRRRPRAQQPYPLTPWAAAHTIAAIASQPPPRVHTRASAHVPNTCRVPAPAAYAPTTISRHDLGTISSRPRHDLERGLAAEARLELLS